MGATHERSRQRPADYWRGLPMSGLRRCISSRKWAAILAVLEGDPARVRTRQQGPVRMRHRRVGALHAYWRTLMRVSSGGLKGEELKI